MRSFKKYHEENSQIYTEFKRLAFQLINRGYKHIGAKQIFEVIRWQTMISGNDGYKLNNSYTSDYARLFEKEHPAYEGIFRKRLCKLKGE
jgi:hypothetical protein